MSNNEEIESLKKRIVILNNERNKYRGMFLEYKMKYEKLLQTDAIEIMNDYYKVDILKNTRSRIKFLTEARQIGMWFMYGKLNMTLAHTGSVFNKDHATALYSYERIENILQLYEKHPKLKETHATIINAIEHINNTWYESSNKENSISVQPTESASQKRIAI